MVYMCGGTYLMGLGRCVYELWMWQRKIFTPIRTFEKYDNTYRLDNMFIIFVN